MLDLALEGKYIAKPSNGWYQLVDQTTGELIGTKMRQEAVEANKDIWVGLFSTTDFADFIKNKYTLATGSLVGEPITEDESNED